MFTEVTKYSDSPTAVRLTDEQQEMLNRAKGANPLFTDRSDSWLIRYAIEKTFGNYLKNGKNGNREEPKS